MTCEHHGPDDGARTWRAPDGIHIDVRGLAPPEPMIAILQLIESSAFDPIIAHLDREPIFLYPELDERGWSYELMPSSCGEASCADEVRLRLVRWAK